MHNMTRMGVRVRVLSWMFALLVGTGLAFPAAGVQTTLRVPLDVDNDPATGCSVELQDPSSPSGRTERSWPRRETEVFG